MLLVTLWLSLIGTSDSLLHALYTTGPKTKKEGFASSSLPCFSSFSISQVQIGCHSDDLTNAKELMRAPVVIRKCQVNCQNQSVSCLWGGLIYIVVPGGSQLGKVPMAIEGAIKAPFFRLGKYFFFGASLLRSYCDGYVRES